MLMFVSTAVLPWIEAGVLGSDSRHFAEFAQPGRYSRAGLSGVFLDGGWIIAAVASGLLGLVCWAYAEPLRKVAMILIGVLVFTLVTGGLINQFADDTPRPIADIVASLTIFLIVGLVLLLLVFKRWTAWTAWLVLAAAAWGLLGSLAVLIDNATGAEYTFLAWAWLMPISYLLLLAGAILVIVERHRTSPNLEARG
ncbi:hypothetical protein EK0264_01470 [Epidermidibacterium keratini]|uniref:DUF998 domain-containing protein n=1 Tax=Epidermidibacterium keratini TaxID=1891644 RepID=A0A7L4YIZ0_9ACTN|nr:hypothetical protein [Epidermidibacterium keratini]QHB99091.1 hypothetical protein EK0264_01470 [Epidermidibacterium keratini]